MMRIVCNHIDWDLEADDEDEIGLDVYVPGRVEIDEPDDDLFLEDGEVNEDYLVDWLSDQYGWCVNGYEYEIVN